MLLHLRDLAARRESFAFESTLSARSFAPWLTSLRVEGYHVALAFVWIASQDQAVQRVANRVRLGGHSIAEPDVRRRYARSIANFRDLSLPIADAWEVYDNTAPPPRLVASGIRGSGPSVLVPAVWKRIMDTDHVGH